jgi:Fe-S-cluster-containing hydrogenase component 2
VRNAINLRKQSLQIDRSTCTGCGDHQLHKSDR